jgi:hypothetical protein
MAKDASKDRGPWKDDVVRRLAKKQVALPIEVVELDHATLLRRTRDFLLIFMGVEFAALAILFAVIGVLPGFMDYAQFTEVDPHAELWLAAFLFGAPLFSGLLVRWLIGRRIRRRPDEADHPWRFRLTAEAMEVTSAQNRTLAGPWAKWTYRGYGYITIKTSRIPISLHVACEDTEISVEFSRFRRREATRIMRGVLQGLASAGNTDR